MMYICILKYTRVPSLKYTLQCSYSRYSNISNPHTIYSVQCTLYMCIYIYIYIYIYIFFIVILVESFHPIHELR